MGNITAIKAICENQMEIFALYKERLEDLQKRGSEKSDMYQSFKSEYQQNLEMYKNTLNILYDEVEEYRDYIKEQLDLVERLREE